jgi:threonylcarbamoyladenosine tRNA methylthiotransferase MtaB
MNIYLDSIGCRLNQAEIENYARQFRAAGHTLVASPEQADLAVVNTCTVTSAADSDSRGKIRKVARAEVAGLVVTGCWSTLNLEDAIAMKGVSRVVSNRDKESLVPVVLDAAPTSFDLEPLERGLIPGTRSRTRAFIKVQDGCDNRCTFCITTLARGAGRSRSIPDVISDIRGATRGSNGREFDNSAAQEIVLTGVHLGSWGQDLSPPQQLKDLVSAILDETEVPRLRLSSLEPWDIDLHFFDLWRDLRLCRHLHLPLQSGSAATLRRMARKTTPRDFAELVTAARSAIPDVAITTDVITGFPGENDEEFAESLEFVQQMSFAGGHVFTYSSRPGTAAENMPDQVPFAVRKARNAQMRAAFEESARLYRENFIGEVIPVLWESATALGPDEWQLSGLTDNYLRVETVAQERLWNQVAMVKLVELVDKRIMGELRQ